MHMEYLEGNKKKEMDLDVRDILLSAGQAPSPHNIQPWVFMANDYSLTIIPDKRKSLKASDPNNRQLFVSMGCAIENLSIAAATRRFEIVRTNMMNNGAYTFDLEHNYRVTPDPLYPMIAERRVDRRKYDGSRLTQQHLQALSDITPEYGVRMHMLPIGNVEADILTRYILDGNKRQLETPEVKRELINAMRFNLGDELKTHDGLATRLMGGVPPMPGWLGRFLMGMALSVKSQNASMLKHINSSSHLVLFNTVSDNMTGWVSLGRTLQRFMLVATSLGVSFSFLSQPFECSTLAKRLMYELPYGNEAPVMALRLGYAQGQPLKSLRHPLSSILVG